MGRFRRPEGHAFCLRFRCLGKRAIMLYDSTSKQVTPIIQMPMTIDLRISALTEKWSSSRRIAWISGTSIPVTEHQKRTSIDRGQRGRRSSPIFTGRTEIIYQSNRTYGWEIIKMKTDGSGQVPLTNNRVDDSFPRWSRTGDGSPIRAITISIGYLHHGCRWETAQECDAVPGPGEFTRVFTGRFPPGLARGQNHEKSKNPGHQDRFDHELSDVTGPLVWLQWLSQAW